MRLSLTTEQEELADAVARFCRAQVDVERLAAWAGRPRGIDDATWQAIADLGWFGLGVGEDHGGSGLGLVEVALLLQEAAAGLIPRSVSGALRGAWALQSLEPDAPELERVARGKAVVTLALDEENVRRPACYRTRCERTPEGFRVYGEKAYVPDAAHADYQIVAARDGAAVALLLVPRENTTTKPLRTFDGGEQGTVRYEGSVALRRLCGDGPAEASLERLQSEQEAIALAEMVGGMRTVLEMTVAYVKEREQFGQKIGVFQAVQHQVADIATDFTAARHLAWQAITRLATDSASAVDLGAARAFAGRAFKRLTLTAHHLHGGAGYVVEHPLHYHSERAQSLCIRYAPEASALRTVARELLDEQPG